MVTVRLQTITVPLFCLFSLSALSGWAEAVAPSDPAAFDARSNDRSDRVLAGEMVGFIPQVVATVGEQSISGNQIKNMIIPGLKARINAQTPLPEEQELRRIALEITSRLVEQQLLFQACREAGFEPSLEVARQHAEELESRLGSERFSRALRKQGMTREQFLDRTASTVALNQWLEEEIFPMANVEEEEIEAFYQDNQENIAEPEQVEVSHILVAVHDLNDRQEKEAAREKAIEIARQLDNEGDNAFAELARQHSDCPSGATGGRLPPFTRGEMVDAFEQAAFRAEVGQITGPILTEHGYHLIVPHNHRPKIQLTYSESRQDLERMLINHKVNRIIEDIIQAQRNKTPVKILLNP